MRGREDPTAGVQLADLADDPQTLASLYRIAEVVNSNLDHERVLQSVTDEATVLVGARYGAYFSNVTVDDGGAYQLSTLSGADAERFAQFPKPRATPVFGPTFHGLGSIRLDDVTADPRYGQVPPYFGMPPGHPPVRSYLAVPVTVRSGEVIGGLFFGHPDVGVFDERAERIAGIVGRHAALAVEKAQRFDAEQHARRQAEATAVRLALLQRLTAEMSAARDTVQVASALVASSEAGLGAVSTVLYLPDESAGKLVPTGPHSFQPDVIDELGPLPVGAHLPVAEAFRTREAVFVASLAERQQRYPALVTATQVHNRVQALAALPLLATSDVVGVLAFGWVDTREFGAEEQAFLEALAHQCAQALERARLYESLQDMVATLQASLLPPSIDPPTGLEMATRYRPVQEGAQVGGDFYDVFPVAPGRSAVVIGDVSGKGVGAASLTALVRHTVRVAARSEPYPAQVLGVLNDELLEARQDHFCTIAYLEVTPAPGACRVRLALAGHPPPLLRTADGRIRAVGEPGMAAGLLPMAEVSDTELLLGPDDTLVLVTDGVVEARDPSGGFADDLLTRAVAEARPDVEAIADEIVNRAVAFAGGEPRDDIAVVVLRVPTEPAQGSERNAVAERELWPVPESVARARDVAELFVDAHGLSHLRDTVVLLTTELVANAVRHAGTSIGLRLVRSGGRVRVEVSDGSRSRPVRRRTSALAEIVLEGDGSPPGRPSGLDLLERLASDWGVRRTPQGKTVWFELAAR